MTISVSDEEDFQPHRLRSYAYAPTPGYFGHAYTPSVGFLSPDPEDERSSPEQQTEADLIAFPHVVEQDDEGTPSEQLPDSCQYLIEWKVTLNHRIVAKDTEQDLIQLPSVCWPQIQGKADKILRRKVARNRRVRPDDTTIVASVNDRSQRDLTKRFESTDINWTAIEKQLLMWANLSRLGKELRLQISVNYVEDNPPPPRYDKRGKTWATKRMLADRDAQLDAEDTSGQPSIWREVYKTMRCPGPPCRHEGQYCWQDPVGKKHYKLRTHQLRSLVRYVEKGGVLETHDDIPDSLREQLYAEDNERITKQKGRPHTRSGSMCPPINITVQPNQPSLLGVTGANDSASIPLRPPAPDSIEIPGLHDVAVEEYSTWQQSRVSREILKADIRKARDLALANGLDLQQVHGDQDPDFFIKHGISVGVARRFVSEIIQWVKLCASSGHEE